MYNIDKIMGMLDSNNNLKVQQKGIEKGKKIKSINVFMLPMHPGCNKNVWENCAKILVDKPDESLNPYLDLLLEWLKDINWPGAIRILKRLKEFNDVEMLSFCLKECVKEANAYGDRSWLMWLSGLLDNEKLKVKLLEETIEILQKYSHNYDFNEEWL